MGEVVTIPKKLIEMRDEQAFAHYEEYKDMEIVPFKSIEPEFRDFCYGFDAGVKAVLESEELKEVIESLSSEYLGDYPNELTPRLERAYKQWNQFTGGGK